MALSVSMIKCSLNGQTLYLNEVIAGRTFAKNGWEMSDVRPLFQALGFVINIEKSSWVPSQIIDWLGFRIDLVKGMFSVPPEKLDASYEAR